MSAKARTRRNKKMRRQVRAVNRVRAVSTYAAPVGPDAKPRHRLTAGRTGQVHAKRLATRRRA